MAVHQLLPSFTAADGPSQTALQLQLVLRRLGLFGELYAVDVEEELEALARPWMQLAPRPDDLVLLHHGPGFGPAGWFSHLPCRRALLVHDNGPTTPAHEGSQRARLVAARAQLSILAPQVELALALSEHQAAGLRASGFRNVHVLPPIVEAERFALGCADTTLLRKLWTPGVTLLTRTRLDPNDRMEDVLALHLEVRRRQPDARLLLVLDGGGARGRYAERLKATIRRTRGAQLLEGSTHAQRVAAYHAATVAVSMAEAGEHVSWLAEAMAAERPVLAFDTPEVAELLGEQGERFSRKDLPAQARRTAELCTDPYLRARVVQGQRERLRALSAEAEQARLGEALRSLGIRPAPRRAPPPKLRVALIVQRFGDVSGGAEKHAEQLAQHLQAELELTVLTTCARDHLTWDNVFPPGLQTVAGLRTIRFPTIRSRQMRPFNRLTRKLLAAPQDLLQEERWVAEQGPLSPVLQQHLAEQAADYDAFIFFTYLYAPTAWGLPLVASRALVVPTAHDEPALSLGVFADVFTRPRALMCNTPEEVALIQRRFPRHARARVVGVGIESPPADPARFARKHQQQRPYLFYVGRVEAGKGIPELLKHHAALVRRDPNAPDLLLAGEASMRVSGKRVRHLGRISDEDKFDGLAGAAAVVVPSRFESLSLLALEAFAQGTPVLANGASAVLEGQVKRSGAGALYRDAATFAAGVSLIAMEREALGQRGRAFAQEHTWGKVVAIYREELERIVERGG